MRGAAGARYARDDLARLRARHDARAGHGPVAAGALRWGEPVLDSAITAIDADGPRYRGQLAVQLAADGAPFEAVAELLWTDGGPAARSGGTGPAAAPVARPTWPPPLPLPLAQLRALLWSRAAAEPTPFSPLQLAVALLRARDPSPWPAALEVEHERARSLVRTLAAIPALAHQHHPARVAAAWAAPSVAAAVALALGGQRQRRVVAAVEQALVLSADHELNASSFTARIAASAGADLYACVGAALATLSGPRHGGECDRFEALVAEAGEPHRARAVVAARLRRGEALHGFGHPSVPGRRSARRAAARGRPPARPRGAGGGARPLAYHRRRGSGRGPCRRRAARARRGAGRARRRRVAAAGRGRLAVRARPHRRLDRARPRAAPRAGAVAPARALYRSLTKALGLVYPHVAPFHVE